VYEAALTEDRITLTFDLWGHCTRQWCRLLYSTTKQVWSL